MTDSAPRTHRVGQHVKFNTPHMLETGQFWSFARDDGTYIPMAPEAWARIDAIDSEQATLTVHSCVMLGSGGWGFQAAEPETVHVDISWLEANTYISQEPLDIEEPLREAERTERAKPILFGGVEESTAHIMRGLAQEPENVDRRIKIGELHYDVRLPAWMSDEEAANTIAAVLAMDPNAFGESVPDDRPEVEPDFTLPDAGLNPDKVD